MKSNPQPDLHPDAESLNAFAELALPEQEREQILLHLGGCSRCRQVVYLAREAVAGLAMDEAAAFRPELDHADAFGFAAAIAPAAMRAGVGADEDATPVKRAGRWFWGWHLAWVPVAALTAIVGVGVFVRVERVQPGFESDNKPIVLAPQSAPPELAKNAAPLPEAMAAAGNLKPAATPLTAKAPALRASSRPESAAKEKLSADAVAPAPPAIQVDGNRRLDSERDRSGVQREDRRQAIAAETNAALFKVPAPASASLPPPPAVDAQHFRAASPGTASSAVHGLAGVYRASPDASASAAAPAAAMKSESISSFDVPEQELSLSAARSASSRKAKITVLPSGLRAVSTASARDYELAIDQSGALFLRRDSGSHWEPVARQWSGRAVEVRMQGGMKFSGAAGGAFTAARAEDSSNGRNESGDSKPDAAATPPVAPEVFEIVNDHDQVWISMDGKTWKEK
jgi:hypothetical protein